MINLENIHSLTDFKRNASSYVERIRETKAPIVLTVNGEAAVIVQDALSFQNLLDRLAIKDADAADDGGRILFGFGPCRR